MKPNNGSHPFDELYGLVLYSQWPGWLRWSGEHQGWLRSRHEAGFPAHRAWLDAPIPGDEVDDDDLAAVHQLLAAFRERHCCDRCWGAPLLRNHFVTPNVLGEPTIYCVQHPAVEVVGSPGGKVKHLGSPFGCVAVQADTVSAQIPGLGRSVVGGWVYGEPLQADEALARRWCGRCTSAAYPTSAEQLSTRAHREHDWRVTKLIRDIQDRSS